jgi:hypothetical protein
MKSLVSKGDRKDENSRNTASGMQGSVSLARLEGGRRSELGARVGAGAWRFRPPHSLSMSSQGDPVLYMPNGDLFPSSGARLPAWTVQWAVFLAEVLCAMMRIMEAAVPY